MEFLIQLAIMLIAAKLCADLFEIFKLPELFGAVIAGIIFGPWLGLVQADVLAQFAEVGIILLLFRIGFEEVNLKNLLKEKTRSILIGITSAFIPFLVGFSFGLIYFDLPVALFVGIALSATSISIPLGNFISAKKLDTKAGRTFLGSAIIDDLIGVIFLVIVASFVINPNMPLFSNLVELGLGFVLFGIVIGLAEYFIPKIFSHLKILIVEEAQFSITLVLVIVLAAIASSLGLSVILGGFVAGVILSRVPKLKERKFITELDAVSEGMFIPLFYAWIGLQIDFTAGFFSMFAVWLTVIAILSKFLPTWIIAMATKLNIKDSLAVAIGMIPRGEVCLAILAVGMGLGILPESLFSSFFLMILVTTFIPIIVLSKVLES
ncbi:cation:proton antiporter [Nanoarchaeota archaeon]